MMETWITIWTVVFSVTLFVFFALVVVVAIGGWSDIKAMFRTLDSQDESLEDSLESSQSDLKKS